MFSSDVHPHLQTHQSRALSTIDLVQPGAALKAILMHFGHMTDDTLHHIATEQAPAGFMSPDLAQAILTGRAAVHE